MKVLVLGASGFIGKPVCLALCRAGHIVYGQTRSEEKARDLAANEIIPIVAGTSPDTNAAWLTLIPLLDVVIDALGVHDQSSAETMFSSIAHAAAHSRPPSPSPKLTFIYSSGTWIFGDNRSIPFTDTSPLLNPDSPGALKTVPPAIAIWRRGHEAAIMASKDVRGIVIRPSLLYGYSGSLTGILFAELAKAKAEGRQATWPGTPGGTWATVHADDLGDLYRRVAEKAVVVASNGGLVIVGSNDALESTDEVLKKACEVVGVEKGYTYHEPKNDFERAITTSTLVRPYLGKTLLGWQPQKPSFRDGLPTFYAAWKAANEQ